MEMNLKTLWWCLSFCIVFTFIHIVSSALAIYTLLYLSRLEETTTIILSATECVDFCLDILVIVALVIGTNAAHNTAYLHVQKQVSHHLVPRRIVTMWDERRTFFYITGVSVAFAKVVATSLLFGDELLSQRISKVVVIPQTASVLTFVLAVGVAGYCPYRINRLLNPDTMKQSLGEILHAPEAQIQVVDEKGALQIQGPRSSTTSSTSTRSSRRNPKNKHKKKKNSK